MNAEQRPSVRLIQVAILAGSALFALVIAFLGGERMLQSDPGADDPIPLLALVACCVGGVTLPIGLVLRSILAARVAQQSGPGRDQAVVQATLVPLAIVEGGILLNLVIWLMSGNPLPTAPVAGVLFLVAAIAFGPVDVGDTRRADR